MSIAECIQQKKMLMIFWKCWIFLGDAFSRVFFYILVDARMENQEYVVLFFCKKKLFLKNRIGRNQSWTIKALTCFRSMSAEDDTFLMDQSRNESTRQTDIRIWHVRSTCSCIISRYLYNTYIPHLYHKEKNNFSHEVFHYSLILNATHWHIK